MLAQQPGSCWKGKEKKGKASSLPGFALWRALPAGNVAADDGGGGKGGRAGSGTFPFARGTRAARSRRTSGKEKEPARRRFFFFHVPGSVRDGIRAGADGLSLPVSLSVVAFVLIFFFGLYSSGSLVYSTTSRAFVRWIARAHPGASIIDSLLLHRIGSDSWSSRNSFVFICNVMLLSLKS